MIVSEMSLKIALRLAALSVVPAQSALDSINDAVKFLSLKLADRQSDLARSSFTVSADTLTVALPFDFSGLDGKPYADGVPLEPLPNDYDVTTQAGTPLYYEVVGESLFIHPTPLNSVDITAKYWVSPDTLIMSDDVPYSGRFDGLLLDMAVNLSVSGYSVLSEQQFITVVEKGLDLVTFPRRPALPSRRPHCNF
jgi:hypothetical protein